MEGGVRSGERSGSLVKKKSSSGCLIIKKKGVGVGVGSSGLKKVFESKKKRKRSELVLSDSDSDSGSWSSDELLEPIRRKVVSRSDKHYNGSVVYKTGSVEDSEFGRNGEIDSERKRSRLDVFEFDEYDVMDRQNMRKSYMGFEAGSSRHVMVQKRKQSYFEKTNRGHSLSVKNRFEMDDDEAHIPLSHLREKFREPSDEPIRLQGKNGVLKVMMNKKNKVSLPRKIDGHQEAEDIKVSSSKDSIKKNRPFRALLDSGSKQSKIQVSNVRREKNEPNLGKSMSTKRDIHMGGVESETEDSDSSLKVGSTSAQARSAAQRVKNEDKGASSAEKVTPIRDDEGKIKHDSGKIPVLYVRREKSERKLGKSTPTKSDMAGKESETEDSDTLMKVGSTSARARSSRKGVKNKVEKASSAGKITPIRGGEGKVQRGSGTEKQLLREKIKNMLLNAGWTIDYRPRRNRDYLDAVYINPSGTAYWSIIKAYDALQKDINVNTTRESSSFTPLPDEILNKLTRQTQKKIEKERKKKRRNKGGKKDVKQAVVSESEEGTDGDRNEEKLSSFMKQNGRKSRKIGRCTLLVRGSDKGLSSESDGFVPYLGKRSLLSWLIDSGPVQLSEKVQYMNRRRTRVLLEGWITRDGVHCGCCSKILTVSKFEIHAGSKLRQPFQNIYLESGVSLLQCQIDAWNKQEEGERCGFHTVDVEGDDPNDDTCGLCGDGGDLICCDGCPSTFHQSCLDIQMLPPGDWHCPNCTCKFCGIAGASVSQENGTTVDALLTCSLCEKKYHELCSQEDALPANSNGTSASFCGRKCRELFDHIQKLLGVKHELEAGYSWSLIHRTDPMSETSHRGFPQRVESNSKLAVALSIMDECFLPIVDRRSGVNLIHNVLYNCGSNFSRLNYSGFYTAILEKGDEIISAASIRMHGTQLAEMPFIATRQIYRRQGMCRRLFCAIETALCSIKVEKMVIPAIAELMHTWTEVFGFSRLDESPRKEMRSMNMLVFPGTDMLQKLLLEQENTEGNIITNSGAKSIKIKENHDLMTDSEKKSGLDSSAGCDFNACDDANVEKGKVVNQNLAAPKSKVSVEDTPSFGSKSVEKLVESAADLNCSSSDTSHDILERENTPAKENTPEDVNGHHNPVSTSSIHDNVEITVQVNSDLNGGGVVDMESDVPVVSEVDLNPEVVRVEGKIRSAAGLEGDAPEVNEEVADTGTVLDSPPEVSAQNTIEKMNGTENHVLGSTLCGTGERVLELNSDMNQPSEVKMEADVDSDAKVDPVNAKVGVEPVYNSLGESFAQNSTEENHDNENPILGSTLFGVENTLQSSAVEDLMDGDAVNSEVSCVKPVLDSVSVGEISVQNGAEDFQENLNSSSVSTVCGSDESELTLKSSSNHQNALDVDSELDPAKGVVSEEVAMIGNNNQPKAEDDARDAPVVES